MASDDSSGSRPAAPILIRIKLRYDDVEVMVQRFATNVGKSGLFLPTKSLQPIGAEIKFELRLADDTPALVGLGRVRAATPPDPSNPRATFGMAIELMRVTPQSRALILRMLEQRRLMGLPEVGLPMTADIDAARRADANAAPAREPVSGPMPVMAPVAPPVVPPGPSTMPSPDVLPGESLLTAPRRATGPMAVAKVLAVTPLGPEPPRRKRMAMSEIIESASGPIASVSVAVPGLDDDIDLGAAIARARTLAGGALDAELEALAEVAAAPVEISIEAASAELARQLGGSAVRRDRSARWAPPPATTAAPPPASPPIEAEAPGAVEAEAPGAVEAEAPGAVEAEAPGAVEAEARGPAEASEHEARSLVPPDVVRSVPRARRPVPHLEHEVEPGQIADELHQLDELDMEDVEHTEMGDIPAAQEDPPRDGQEASEVDHELLAARLEAQLAEAEAEADADARELMGALGAAPDADLAGYADHPDEPAAPVADDDDGEPPLDVSLEEIDDFEILAEADADDEDLLAAHGEQDVSDSRELYPAPPAGRRRSSQFDFAARLDLDDESDMYFAVPADEFSARHVVDDLHDELMDGIPDGPADGRVTGRPDDRPRLRDPLLDSAGHALAAFDFGDEPFDEPAPRRGVRPIFEPEPSESFTLAGIPSDSLDLDLPPVVRSEPAASSRPVRSQRASVHGEPAILHVAPPPARPSPRSLPSLYDVPVEDYELEHALEALDVDLDDLSIPHAATQLAREREPSKSRPTPARPQAHAPPAQARVPAGTPSRAVRQTGASEVDPGSGRAPRLPSEDGVVIDFDEDDD